MSKPCCTSDHADHVRLCEHVQAQLDRIERHMLIAGLPDDRDGSDIDFYLDATGRDTLYTHAQIQGSLNLAETIDGSAKSGGAVFWPAPIFVALADYRRAAKAAKEEPE